MSSKIQLQVKYCFINGKYTLHYQYFRGCGQKLSCFDAENNFMNINRCTKNQLVNSFGNNNVKSIFFACMDKKNLQVV